MLNVNYIEINQGRLRRRNFTQRFALFNAQNPGRFRVSSIVLMKGLFQEVRLIMSLDRQTRVAQ